MPDEPTPRKADYRVGALNQATEVRANIGSAFNNADGTISIILNPFVSLYQQCEYLITLFPVEPSQIVKPGAN